MSGNPMLQMFQNQMGQSQGQSPTQQPTNNILEGLKQSAPALKNMWKELEGGNPQQIMQKMFGDNPMMNMAMGNPEQAVRGMLNAQGIDVNEFISTIQGILK